MYESFEAVRKIDLLKILIKSLKANKSDGKPVIFFNFHGHINVVDVQIFKNGWEAFSKDYVIFSFSIKKSCFKSDDPNECLRYIDSCMEEQK